MIYSDMEADWVLSSCYCITAYLNRLHKKSTYLNNFIRYLQEELRYDTALKIEKIKRTRQEGRIISRSLCEWRDIGGDRSTPGERDATWYGVQKRAVPDPNMTRETHSTRGELSAVCHETEGQSPPTMKRRA
jgi:hypothetical protein